MWTLLFHNRIDRSCVDLTCVLPASIENRHIHLKYHIATFQCVHAGRRNIIVCLLYFSLSLLFVTCRFPYLPLCVIPPQAIVPAKV